jgi:hypothetical protein
MVLALLAAAWAASAHPGHVHKIMGTVAAMRNSLMQVTATDGKSVDVALNDKTIVVRGKSAIAASELQAGMRVVVSATETRKDGKTVLIATRIQVGAAAAPDGKK